MLGVHGSRHAPRGGAPGYAIGVVVHPTRPVASSLRSLVAWAGEHGARVLARASDGPRLAREGVEGIGAVADAAFAAEVDGVVSLGGDGTMLGAMRAVSERPVPVLGVHHGALGFLVEVTADGLDAALAQLVAGRATLEPHSGLRVERAGARSADPLEPAVAFNDVVLTRRGRPGAVSVDLDVNGDRYGYYRCDALVVATPTGSTAYNYAAGGPVLSPSAQAAVVTPVAPMSGISRPVVFSADDVVTLHVRPARADEAADALGAGVDVDVDGVPAGRAEAGQAVGVLRLAEPAQVVRLDTGAHERRSRVKLSLLDLPLRPDQLTELVPDALRRHEG